MHRIFGFALLVICVHPLGATNPEDIEFRVHLGKDTHAYHMGESIEQTAGLERALASALSHPTNWSLTPGTLDRLRSDRLTEPCRVTASRSTFLNPYPPT